ncbi:hypothetical protein Vadar_003019 [Vaccinium darrowii]|uniref:Uncharacterized protein n=1 Tax=Vaccinium darrowii TaxID=229202 RepID=A0ACB7Y4I0_9ERIC|nr:hypothetical protein Vadar_003019 [Vaccinium darrowii]
MFSVFKTRKTFLPGVLLSTSHPRHKPPPTPDDERPPSPDDPGKPNPAHSTSTATFTTTPTATPFPPVNFLFFSLSMENEGLDNQSMVGSSPSIDPFERLYSIEEETIEMQSNLLVDNTMVESQVAVIDIVPFVEPKCREEYNTFRQANVDNSYIFRQVDVENVGVTSTEMTFSMAFAFMDGEKEDNYMWVLEKLKGMMDPDSLPEVVVTDRELALMNAIARVFPKATHLLCRWHIEKNVFAKSRRKFDDKTWQQFKHAWCNLLHMSTISDYEQGLATLKRDFAVHNSSTIEYVENTWLGPYRDRFVAAWTDNVMHLDNLTSNRTESAHKLLKGHLAYSEGDFENAWEKMHDLVGLQITGIKASFEKSLTCWQHIFVSLLLA